MELTTLNGEYYADKYHLVAHIIVAYTLICWVKAHAWIKAHPVF